jgi:ubiquinone/menaquinone biosynthesis C-methylase UbiE
LSDLKHISRKCATSFYHMVAKSWKRKRFLQFIELVKPLSGEKIIDLGGAQGTFFYENIDLVKEYDLQVVIADINSDSLKVAESRGFSTYLMRENELPEMEAGMFDIVFCNSVIEHVTFPKECVWNYTQDNFYIKALDIQKNFSRNIERISKKYYVQTPCIDFPVESHTWLPSFYSYPPNRKLHVERLKNISKYWIKATTPDYNLLSEEQFTSFFPSATGVFCNRVLGFAKELIAYRAGS